MCGLASLATGPELTLCTEKVSGPDPGGASGGRGGSGPCSWLEERVVDSTPLEKNGIKSAVTIINRSISNCTFFLTLGIGHDSSAA